VEDLGSTNGTAVDGTRIAAPTRLASGQVVTFGRCRLELVAPAPHATGPTVTEVTSSVDAVAAASATQGWSAAQVFSGSGTIAIVLCGIERASGPAGRQATAGWTQWAAVYDQVVRRQVERGGGTVVASLDDGVLLAFTGALGAVRCAAEIQRALDAHRRSHPDAGLWVRMGIHAGEAVAEEDASDGDLFGRPLALAARIANQARGGEILVSSVVREMVEPHGDLAFGPTRERALVGLVGRHVVHPVEWRIS
jgi:class 3 adenylate cyclase